VVLDSVPNPDAGQVGEIESLFRTYRHDLVRLATLLTGSQWVAEDLVQDTFAKLTRRKYEVDHPATYVRIAVVNACRSYHRRRIIEQRNYTLGSLDCPDKANELWDVLSQLSSRQRTAIILRYYLDLPAIEVARMMRCRPATVRSLIQRGLLRLRKELEE
jgi:RNA polymerase sigma factor (sigma-70 family)